MPDAIITSTESTFGTISGTFAADQSTITGTVTGIVAGTLDGTVGVPGPGVPLGGTEGQIIVKQSSTDYDTAWADNSAETLTATVRNETGATLTKGTVVYITGAAGNKALVSKASASSEATSSKTFAILSADILNNQNGTAVTVGLLKGLDTSALTEGGSLWLSTTAGQWTQTMPTAPNHAVFLGTVTRVHANQGTVEVRIQNGYELQELHNVKITSVSNGQVLKYDSAQSLWVNGTDVGVPAGGTAGQFLQKIDGTDYNTDWVTVNLSAYAVKANNLSDLTSFSDARDNLNLGTLNTPVFAGVTAQGSGSNVANLTPTSLSLTHATSGSFTIQPSVGITFPDSTVQTTAFTGSVATTWGSITGTLSSQTDLQTALDGKYSTSNPAGYITSSALTPYLTSATAASTYQTISGMSSYLTTSAAASTYYPLSSNPAGYLTSASLSGYATESWVTSQGYETTANAAATYYPLVGNPSGFVNTTDIADMATQTWVSANFYSASNPDGFINGATADTLYYSISNPSGFITNYQGDLSYLKQSYNLSDLTDVAVARSNLGLGTLATVNDAPSDGTTYGRNNGAWVAAGGGGASTDYQAFTTPGTFTWTKPSGAKWVDVMMFGGGGGGSSGERRATTVARNGGAGGSAAGFVLLRIPADILGSTESVVVGAGGNGGASVTSDNSGSNYGSNGGNSRFFAFTAKGGNGATTSGGAGVAGWFQGTNGLAGTSGGAQSTTTGTNGTSLAQAISSFTGSGAGGGGGAAASSTVSSAGGNGGSKPGFSTQSGLTTSISGGAGGTTGGTPPTQGSSFLSTFTIPTGSGGGAYRSGQAGMNGANGMFGGGAGGGGSASDNGFASGAGGAGGGGAVYIITYC